MNNYPTTLVPPPNFLPINPNNTMNPTQGEPKRKRVQVSAACQQCKRAHAACSNTRPCDRCVRINQAAACIAGSSHVSASTPISNSGGMPVNMPPNVGVMSMDATGFNMALSSQSGGFVDMQSVPVAHSPNVQFTDQDLSKFLFEEQNDFPLGELHGQFCLESSSGSESDCSVLSTPSPCSAPSTPSPNTSAAQSPATYTPSTPISPTQQHQYQQQQYQQQQQQYQQQQLQQQHQLHQQQQQQLHQQQQQHQHQHQHQQQQQSTPMSSPLFVQASTPNITLPPRMIGPSAQSIAATIAATPNIATDHPTFFDAHAGAPPSDTQGPISQPTESVNARNVPVHDLFMNAKEKAASAIDSPAPQTNMAEMFMTELMQQNKRMESLLMSMTTEMKSLRQEVTQLRGEEPLVTTSVVPTGERANGPATAVWSVSDGGLLEHNQKFAQLLDLSEVPKGYSMNHFFGGPCSKAASARMNHHLENIKNAQPVTDYAVIERKRVSGDLMRLMIVVNVVPTAVPVFITTMYEL